MNDPRFSQLMAWISPFAARYALDLDSVESICGDASQRRYFRVRTHKHDTLAPAQVKSYVLMDDPVKGASFDAFVDIQHRLHQVGCHVPAIYEHTADFGFMLIEDLGGINYYVALHTEPSEEERQHMYRDAISALVRMQTADTEGLPVYTAERLMDELEVFTEWYLHQYVRMHVHHGEKKALHHVFEQMIEVHLSEGQVLVHRDYHSPNLMLTAHNRPAIIDFQDAVKGPISYDVASFCFDARFTIAEVDQLDWAVRYWQAAKAKGLPVPQDFAVFHEHCDWMSLQRNLRILGTFARLAIRDHKPHYLEHIPRVLDYVRQITHRYSVFAPINKVLNRAQGIEEEARYTF